MGHLMVRVPHLTFGIEGFDTPWLHFRNHLKSEVVFDLPY
jgi:hypothetical protein